MKLTLTFHNSNKSIHGRGSKLTNLFYDGTNLFRSLMSIYECPYFLRRKNPHCIIYINTGETDLHLRNQVSLKINCKLNRSKYNSNHRIEKNVLTKILFVLTEL